MSVIYLVYKLTMTEHTYLCAFNTYEAANSFVESKGGSPDLYIDSVEFCNE